AAMLAAIGVGSIDDLFAHVPANLRARAAIALPEGLTEPELRRHLGALAARNAGASGPAVFLGAGAYPHWVPAVVDQILLRSEFATAYTPYQPEVSQGTLQATFEFQTFAALVLGLEVANASMYDGASATAEAVLMARRLLPGRRVNWLARALHPHSRAAVAVYRRGRGHCGGRGAELRAPRVLRRPGRRALRHARALRAQHAGPSGRRDGRRARPPRLRADPRHARAAHSPRACHLQHLHQSGSVRA